MSEDWSDSGSHEPADDEAVPVPDEAVPVPDEGAPATWSAPEPTGVRAVDEAVAELAALELLPTGEHVTVFDAVHRKLQDALADLDGT